MSPSYLQHNSKKARASDGMRGSCQSYTRIFVCCVWMCAHSFLFMKTRKWFYGVENNEIGLNSIKRYITPSLLSPLPSKQTHSHKSLRSPSMCECVQFYLTIYIILFFSRYLLSSSTVTTLAWHPCSECMGNFLHSLNCTNNRKKWLAAFYSRCYTMQKLNFKRINRCGGGGEKGAFLQRIVCIPHY